MKQVIKVYQSHKCYQFLGWVGLMAKKVVNNNMAMNPFEKLNEMIRRLIRLLDEEYNAISEILQFSMDSLPSWEKIRELYIIRFEQIKELQERNHTALEAVESLKNALYCTNADINSLYEKVNYDGAEQRIQEKESFTSLLDSLELIDDDDKALLEDARKQGADIASSLTEASMDMPLSEQEQATLRRKQLADALRNGEPITLSQSGELESSTADALEALRKQLADGGELIINSDGSSLNHQILHKLM